MDHLEVLVLAPFREIVDKGTTAATNAQAGGVPPMLTCAQNLTKEGQRALSRLEPLCQKGIHDGGEDFVTAVQNDEDLNESRAKLDDLLWGFDEFIETDGFDADKFSELQAMSRKVAPKVVDKVRRIALAKMDMSTSPFSSPVPRPSPGQFSGTSLEHNDSYDKSVRGSTASSNLSVSEYGLAEDATGRMHRISLRPGEETFRIPASDAASPELVAQKAQPRVTQAYLKSSSDESVAGKEEHVVPKEQPPPPPTTNPWDISASPAPHEGHDDSSPSGVGFERRSLVPSLASKSPRLNIVSPPEEEEPEVAPLSLNSVPSRANMTAVHEDINTLVLNARGSFPIPTREPPRPESEAAFSASSIHSVSSDQRPYQTIPHHPEASRERQDVNRASQIMASPVSYEHNTTLPASSSLSSSYERGRDAVGPWLLNTDPSYKPTIGSPPPPMPHENADVAESGLEPVPIENNNTGLIPVEPDRIPDYHPVQDCRITSKSSFHLNKGFCKGAREALRGGKGVVQGRRHGFTSLTTRCVGCEYELNADQVEYDRSRSSKGTYTTRHGISYRLRFLQKSHLTMKRVDHIMYACVFCIQQGHTLNECDATVFFTAKQLLGHLARHPRPLPAVPGFTVIDGEVVPPAFKNNFDLHLTGLPLPHVVNEHMIEIARRPSGIAREQVRAVRGEEVPADKSPAHELAQGGRLTGITWPDNFKGEYMVAWHEGLFAFVPNGAVQLLPPPPEELDMRKGRSPVRAVARWEFVPPKEKDKAHWLKFEEGEEIIDICWKYQEHWCWTGTNVKGKRGIFPQAYINMTTLDRGNDKGAEQRRLSTLARYEAQRRRDSQGNIMIGIGGVCGEAKGRRS